ncbi:MAG: hypothetical protein AABX65_02755 [Nanoarchaeota archaeon]
MDEEKIRLLAIIFEAIKDAVTSLENAQKEQDSEKAFSAKKEILKFQNEISKIIAET